MLSLLATKHNSAHHTSSMDNQWFWIQRGGELIVCNILSFDFLGNNCLTETCSWKTAYIRYTEAADESFLK